MANTYLRLTSLHARTLIVITLSGVTSCVFSTEAASGWFGPSNYDECILDGMKGVTSDVAAKAIIYACRNKFPNTGAVTAGASHKMAWPEVTKLSGRANGAGLVLNLF